MCSLTGHHKNLMLRIGCFSWLVPEANTEMSIQNTRVNDNQQRTLKEFPRNVGFDAFMNDAEGVRLWRGELS